MRFASLGSGSRGNALVVEHAGTRLLIDCGFSASQCERRLQRLGLSGADIDALIITHEHQDHWRGASRFSRRWRLPVWMTAGTHAATRQDKCGAAKLYSPHEAFTIGDLEISPCPVPHDAREPAQLIVANGDKRLAVLTDLGHVTPHVLELIGRCDALVLEANHDLGMLADGPYPPRLKRRVGGRFGHLSNCQAAAFLGQIDSSGLQHVVAGHISEKNNSPELVRAALADALGCAPDWVHAASQDEGLPWRSLTNS